MGVLPVAGLLAYAACGGRALHWLCATQTVRFKNELERNITIKLGYANAKVRPAAGSCTRLQLLLANRKAR